MSRRSGSTGRGSVTRWFTSDPSRLAVAVIAGGAVLSLGAVALGGFVRYGQVLAGLLYALAVLLPILGAILAISALWWALVAADSSERPLYDGEPPEKGDTRTKDPVARETKWQLDEAANDWYRCRAERATAEVVERLDEGAIRTLRARRGLDRHSAREAVRSGTWTDDRVAAAFLSTDVGQPLEERLRGAIDPGKAFERRVRRTLSAIDEIGADSRSLEQPAEGGRETSTLELSPGRSDRTEPEVSR
ncbi:Yip1 family protein [Natronobacterium texcoconense]|uniref:Uncharacterized protein n=1 Tax=Natronobacterium texcoconense TaxID=1095778 RepID=A0A1H0ZH02_NATTX|nr:Yip1 family protein [Natronobacterium texcoconense]SDQ26775.1 hypothetical protein SAMN04489842_0286 [Natronobacterium texcoconense]